MASWSSNPPPNPSHAGGADPSLRDACEAGTPPPAATRPEQADTSPTQHGEAASRPLPLEVERVVALTRRISKALDEITELVGGHAAPSGIHRVPRATFDALPASQVTLNIESSYGQPARTAWLKDVGPVAFYTYEPPVEVAA